MKKDEDMLLYILGQLTDDNAKAILLQSFIAEHGPLSEETGAKVRKILAKTEPA